MTNLTPSDDDNNLVDFLRKNQPIPPLKSKNSEQELMELINRNPRVYQPQRNSWGLIFPGLITMGMLLFWSSDNWSISNSQASIDDDAIEIFLVNNWQDALIENNNIFLTQSEESYLLLPISEQAQFLSVSP